MASQTLTWARCCRHKG